MRVFLLTICLLTATLTQAQDNIVLRTGEEIPAKVLEVNQTELRYRKAGNPDGPVYTAPLRDVLLIKYANGTKDSFGSPATALTGRNPSAGSGVAPVLGAAVPAAEASNLARLHYQSRFFNRHYVDASGQHVSADRVKSLLYNQPDALTAFDRGRSLRTWSVVTAIPAVALIGAGIGVLVAGSDMGDGGRNGKMNDQNGTDTDVNTPTGTTTADNSSDGHGGGDGAIVGAAMIGSGVLLGVASVWLDHRASVQFRRAADQYNNRPATSLRIAPASRGVGIGLALRF